MKKKNVADNEKLNVQAIRGPGEGEFATFALEDDEDDKAMKTSLIGAIGVHAILLLINFPALHSEPQAVEEKPDVMFMMKQQRFERKEVPKRDIPQKIAVRVPIPDPTPDDPEPIREWESEPELDLPALDDYFPIPSAPPVAEVLGPIHITSEVRKPEKIHSPRPHYTEVARKARISGLVILESIIDKRGEVTSVRVLRGLPMGLSEAAVSAVKQWRFKPATMRGKPVDVYFTLTINFTLQ